MKFASYRLDSGRATFGVLDASGTLLSDLANPDVPSLREALEFWGTQQLRERAAAVAHTIDAAAVTWLPPITEPRKILCIGFNYATHVAETAREQPTNPSVFVRFIDSLVGHRSPVVRPHASDQFDYEAELAVVIGRRARHVASTDAMSYVAGYSCMAENSVRDFQKHAAQATPGKNFVESGAFGPCLVTPDEAGDPGNLEVIGRLNGTVVQRDVVARLIFPIPQLIAYLSTFTTLNPGDVIATGTPAGVGSTRKPPLFMKPGDVFEVEIPRVGLLRNAVVQEAAGIASV